MDSEIYAKSSKTKRGLEKMKKENLKQESRKESLKKIINAATEIFVSHGFAGASMSKIAQKAGMNQALIYHYFASKEELWKEIKKQAILKSNLSLEFNASTDSLDQFIDSVFENRFMFYKKNPKLRTLIAWEKLQVGYKNLYSVHERFEGIFTKQIEKLQEKGMINNKIDPKIIDTLILSSCDGVFDIIPHFFSKELVSKKEREYMDLVKNLLKNGLKN